MQHITTVLGDIPPKRLGFCQSHEHIWISKGRSAQVNSDLCLDDQSLSCRELEHYRIAGGCAVVDAQPPGCGRNAHMLEEISRESGVHVIASTGFHKMVFYPENHWVFSFEADQLTELFIDELTTGLYTDCDTDLPAAKSACRAGQIKAALDAGAVSAQYQKLFHAAAEAAKATGAALMVHIEAGADPVALADFLFRQKVALNRVIFCHMDRSVADIAVHKELCARGIFVEYDTIARPKYHDDDREVEIILEMLEAGWEMQLLMSLDVTRARMRSNGGSVDLCYLLETFLPLLKRRCVSGDTLESIFVANPARVFAKLN